jgi:TPR repeat protein
MNTLLSSSFGIFLGLASGMTVAQNKNIAERYEYAPGDIVEQNVRLSKLTSAAARANKRKGAERRSPAARYALGVAYEYGNGETQSDEEAVFWYTKAAELGFADAQIAMARMLENGKGIEQDSVAAAAWCQKAADNGAIVGQYYLGLMFENGRGKTQDFRQAAHWYEKAAQRGFAKAQLSLAALIAQGLGVEKNQEQAHKWLSLAIRGDGGGALAKKYLAILESEMNGEQIAQAKHLALDWRPVEMN